MKGGEGPSAVTLQARLPTSETISIEAVASEEMMKVKERIASMGGLDVDIFTLTFDGVVVAAAADDGGGQLVGDLPFEDGSILEVVVCKRQAALLRLSGMGVKVKGKDLFGAHADFSGFFVSNKAEIEEDKMCEVVNLLLDAGVSGWEKKALHVAAKLSFLSCVEVLLTRTSVDVNSEVGFPDEWMHLRTALHRATSEEVVALLLRHNADVNARNGNGGTVLHRYFHPSVVHLLLEHRADTEAKDREGRTPLFMANLEVAEALLEHNADVKARDNRGNTCLHHAVERGDFNVLPILLRHNADVTARNDEGKTALDLVPSDSRYLSAMRYLLEDPSLAHDLELFESGRELSDVSRLPVVQLISGSISPSG